MRATTSVASPVFIMHKLEVTIIETIALCDLAVGGVMIVRVHTDAGATGIGQAELPLPVMTPLLVG